MKRRFFIVLAIFALWLCVLPACEMDTESFARSSVKAISKPYIAQYECVEARLGEDNFMELVETNEMSKISVSELAAKALVNCSTFYLHYTDIQDIAAPSAKLYGYSYKVFSIDTT